MWVCANTWPISQTFNGMKTGVPRMDYAEHGKSCPGQGQCIRREVTKQGHIRRGVFCKMGSKYRFES